MSYMYIWGIYISSYTIIKWNPVLLDIEVDDIPFYVLWQ